MQRKVYVINKSGHDYSDAIRFGELVFLSNGTMKRNGINEMYRKFISILKYSKEEDFILITSLASAVGVACSIFGYMHGRLNLLLYEKDKSGSGRYIERTVKIGELL